MRALLVLLLLGQISAADFLEIRQVVEAGKGAKSYDAPRPPAEVAGALKPAEKITVSDDLVIGDQHLAEAWPTKEGEDLAAVSVTLNAEGEKRMIAATKDATPRITRMAVIVDGKVQTAPVLNSVPLGKNFEINGFSWEEAQALAKKLHAAMEAAKKPAPAKEEKKE